MNGSRDRRDKIKADAVYCWLRETSSEKPFFCAANKMKASRPNSKYEIVRRRIGKVNGNFPRASWRVRDFFIRFGVSSCQFLFIARCKSSLNLLPYLKCIVVNCHSGKGDRSNKTNAVQGIMSVIKLGEQKPGYLALSCVLCCAVRTEINRSRMPHWVGYYRNIITVGDPIFFPLLLMKRA